MCKRSMASVLPSFNSERVLHDYLRSFYLPAAKQGKIVAAGDFKVARELAHWMGKVSEAWPGGELQAVRPELATEPRGRAPASTPRACASLASSPMPAIEAMTPAASTGRKNTLALLLEPMRERASTYLVPRK